VDNLPERQGESRTVEILREARWPLIAASCAALSYGALSIFGGGVIVASAGGGSGMVPASINPPTAPTLDFLSLNDSTIRMIGSAFSGSGGDSHASASWKIGRYAEGAATCAGVTAVAASLADADSLEARTLVSLDSLAPLLDSTLVGCALYTGTPGGPSAWSDTTAFVHDTTTVGLHPNEPAGFVTVWNNPGTFDSLPRRAGGGQPGWFDVSSYEANAEVVADAGNPTGSGFSVKFTHRTSGGGWGGKLNRFTGLGSNFGGVGYTGGGLEQQYIMLRLYIPTAGLTPCQGEINGIKLNYYGVEPTAKIGEGANEFYSATCSGGDLWAVQHGGLPGPDPHQFYLTGAGYAFPPAFDTEWTVEYWRQAESANGAGDGELRIWVNGTEVNDSPWSGLDWSDPNFSGRLLDGFEMYHSQYAADNEHYWYQRELYISGCEPGSC
jgi:hypothetical protein